MIAERLRELTYGSIPRFGDEIEDGLRVGDGCATLHDEMMRFIQVNRLELDELWSYVGKKQRKVKQTDPADLGDQYVFIGIDATRKGKTSESR